MKSPVAKFYETKAPAAAVELAASDHRNGSPAPSFEFIAALKKAQAMAEAFPGLVSTLDQIAAKKGKAGAIATKQLAYLRAQGLVL